MLKFEVLIALTFIGVLASLCLDAYAANEKCCICQRRMSKFSDRRILMSSKNFEHDLSRHLELTQTHQAGTASSVVSVFLL